MKLLTAHVMLVVTRRRRDRRLQEYSDSRRLALVAPDEAAARAKVEEWLAAATANRELMEIDFGSLTMPATDVRLAVGSRLGDPIMLFEEPAGVAKL